MIEVKETELRDGGRVRVADKDKQNKGGGFERERKKKIGMKFKESESTFSEESTSEIWCRLILSDSVHRMNLETLSSPCLPLQQDFITCVKGALNTHTGQHHQSRLCTAAEGTCVGLLCPLWC